MEDPEARLVCDFFKGLLGSARDMPAGILRAGTKCLYYLFAPFSQVDAGASLHALLSCVA